MFIIFGNGFKTYIEAKGKFNCPNCNKKEIYEVKTQQEYFKLFFISIWPIDKKTPPIVECLFCKENFNTDVLKNNNFYLDGSSVLGND
ncbi:zinc-ribbon domain-containing protein [Pelagibacterales bacterium SAG-MED18]|nr:zinc-ribbon domain-containing protein [Pelagibacterales bacterium SAG-MED18]|tara:strand:- start:1276 stop:1539 length:264 start_codon:yes stop_codon:yes gene_type:complete